MRCALRSTILSLAMLLLALAGGCRSYEVVGSQVWHDGETIDYEIVRSKETGRLGFHDPKLGSDAQWYAPPDITAIGWFNNGAATITDASGKIGIITRDGKVAFPPQFSWVNLEGYLSGVPAAYVKDEKGRMGLVGADGRTRAPCEAENVSFSHETKIVTAYYPDKSLRLYHADCTPLTTEALLAEDRRVYDEWRRHWQAGTPWYALADMQISIANALDKTPPAGPGDDGLSGLRPPGIDTGVMRAHWSGQKDAAYKAFGPPKPLFSR